MTSLGKKTAPHWFLPEPEVSQSAGQPSPYFPKKLPRKLGAPRCPPPGVGGGQCGARRQPVTGMQLSRLPVLHPGATSGCAVMCTIVEESSLQARTHARKHTHTHTHGRVPCTLEHSCTECARGAVRQSGAGWRWGRAAWLVPLLSCCLGGKVGTRGGATALLAGGGGGLVIRKECERGEAEEQHE